MSAIVMRPILVFEINNMGERSHPWGQPVEDKRMLDKMLLTLTLTLT